MQGVMDWRDAVCVNCGYFFSKILPSIVGDETDSYHMWILECTCGEAYEIEYKGSFDECVFLHLHPNEGGPRIYLRDFIDLKNDKPGFIYLMHAKGTNSYKIGKSFDPTQREYQLNTTKSPFEIGSTVFRRSLTAA